jgi:hypothetical protein
MSIYGRYTYHHMGYCCFVRHQKLIIYYTDLHEVDEDTTAISLHGGSWTYESMAGVTLRYTNCVSFHTTPIGASRRRHWKIIKYYTDWHDVDEDMVTITYQSGYCYDGTRAGVMRRSADYSRDSTFVDVAYKDKNTILSSRMVFLMI